MDLNIKNDLKYYTFSNLQKTGIIKHCFSTKYGGVSSGVYKSMNLAFREDEKSNVIKNFEIICSSIGIDYKTTVFSSQTHDDKIYKVTKNDIGKGLINESDIYGYDALITNEKNIALVTFYADCVPIFLVDPIKKVIGMAHSGWRGTVKEIGAKTVLEMTKEYNCNVKDMLVGIAPSIKKCCFQVGEEVVKQFNDTLDFAYKYICEDEEKDKYKIDLQGIIIESLKKIGISNKNIENSNICTVCNSDMFFSHRVMGDKRGSLAGIISLDY